MPMAYADAGFISFYRPTASPEYRYTEWSREYNSDVLYFKMLNQDVIVLNSRAASIDLLDKRGSNYCDRPDFILFDIMGFRATLTFLRWSPRFRMHRKLLQSALSKAKITQYHALQTTEARRMVRALVARPENWETLLRRYATAVVLGVGFGVSIVSDEDPYIRMAADASYALGHGGAPAGTLVDFFPLLRYIPECIAPHSLRFARKWHGAIRRIHEVPFAAVQREVINGTARASFIREQLEAYDEAAERGETSQMSLEDIKGAAGAIYAAGQDTTWSTTVVFVLNMVLHPEVQRRAQQEIDSVVGADRLPTFSDRPHLPYLEYVLQESLRWCPVSPLGIPHKSLEDDVYRGMFIPKGSIVYANARAMCHNPSTYSDPEAFDPMRYAPISEGGRGEPYPVGQFGFGRRICVGRHLADSTLWIIMATILATLGFEKAVGDDGQRITPTVTLTSGLTSHPEHFPCQVKARCGGVALSAGV
ncbi:cytochrome P450 [Schizophyllum amplum]|uniref:Cytochrome P450 n=1 Tax=Schizophyllum amplum TaxID=97359 RepID=A0A550CJV7_9AGAR|nr:cytochrome P450 [Auriculariopsis ampla]